MAGVVVLGAKLQLFLIRHPCSVDDAKARLQLPFLAALDE
jgi:hypothetical protein